MTPPHFPILHKFAAQGLPDTEVFSCIEEHFVIFFLYFYPVLEPMHTEELMVLWGVEAHEQIGLCLQ